MFVKIICKSKTKKAIILIKNTVNKPTRHISTMLSPKISQCNRLII